MKKHVKPSIKTVSALAIAVLCTSVVLCLAFAPGISATESTFGNDTMIEELLIDEYTVTNGAFSASDSGLSAPWNVGVDKNSFENTVLYKSIPGKSEYVIYASQYGADGTDMYDDSLAVANAITAAKEYKAEHPSQAVRIILPEGDLDFIQGKNPTDCNYAIDLSGVSDLILQGDDTNLYMYGDMSAFHIADSKNVLITGVNVDWGRVPFSVGRVIERSDDLLSVTVQVNSGYQIDTKTVIQGYLEYDQFTYLPRENGNDVYPANIAGYTYLGDQKIQIRFVNPVKKMPLATLVVLRHKLYENDAIFAENSQNVYFETVNIYSAPGMGIRAYSCENLYLNRFSTCLKPNTDRLITVTADAVHTINCKGDLRVTNCIFENRGDDALNTHGMYLKIGKILSENQVYAYNPRGYHFAPEVGDVIEISHKTDLSKVQNLTVKKVVLADNGDGYIITFTQKLDESVSASMNLNEGDVICNPSCSTNLYFVNNIVRNSRCRGILIQTKNAVVMNNTFANMMDCAILMTSDTGAWYESMPSANVTIKNNKIVGNNRSWTGSQGEITAICFGADNAMGATGLQDNIEISNNFIANGRRAGIFLNSVGNVKIKDNIIHNVGTQAQISMLDTAVGFTNARNVEITGNLINPNGGTTFKPAYIGGGTEADTFTVENNVGIDISDIIPDVKIATDVDKTQAEITVGDNSLDDWDGVGTIVHMVGKTDVDQEVVDPSESDFSNQLKVAWKDDGVYFAFSVTDDELVFNDTAQYWFGDGVEVFLSTNTTSQSSMGTVKLSEPGCMQMFMSPSKTGCLLSDVRSSEEVLAKQYLIKMSCWLKSDNSGYEGEAFIPFDAIEGLEDMVKAGSEFSFCVNFFDVDSIGKQISVSNADAPVENNKFVPARMPKIKLIGGNNNEEN